MKNIMEQFDGYDARSDQVRLALRAIPTDIAFQLTDHQLKDLTVGIIELARQVTKDHYWSCGNET